MCSCRSGIITYFLNLLFFEGRESKVTLLVTVVKWSSKTERGASDLERGPSLEDAFTVLKVKSCLFHRMTGTVSKRAELYLRRNRVYMWSGRVAPRPYPFWGFTQPLRSWVGHDVDWNCRFESVIWNLLPVYLWETVLAIWNHLFPLFSTAISKKGPFSWKSFPFLPLLSLLKCVKFWSLQCKWWPDRSRRTISKKSHHVQCAWGANTRFSLLK